MDRSVRKYQELFEEYKPVSEVDPQQDAIMRANKPLFTVVLDAVQGEVHINKQRAPFDIPGTTGDVLRRDKTLVCIRLLTQFCVQVG